MENSFGILKEKFPCLNYMRLPPQFCCKIFKCTTTLCNISRSREDENDVLRERSTNDDDSDDENEEAANEDGIRRLNEMIVHFS